MKVSIVTVVFNSVSVIEETILSVIYQKNATVLMELKTLYLNIYTILMFLLVNLIKEFLMQ